jgi:hypothetical protein
MPVATAIWKRSDLESVRSPKYPIDYDAAEHVDVDGGSKYERHYGHQDFMHWFHSFALIAASVQFSHLICVMVPVMTMTVAATKRAAITFITDIS